MTIQLTPHFTREELACHHCGEMRFAQVDLDALETLRVEYAGPMEIVSGYRCPVHNAEVSHTGLEGPHTVFAVDVRAYGESAYHLVRTALELGWTGVGFSQKGPQPVRYVHLDRMSGPTRPWVWSY